MRQGSFLILMGYLNPIYRYGFEEFCISCREVGIDGMIIPDLPFRDYMESYKEIAERHGLRMIMLITPETSEERVRLIDEHTSGFIYAACAHASGGIIGSRFVTLLEEEGGDAAKAIARLKSDIGR